jgi:predicted transcriptional regulator
MQRHNKTIAVTTSIPRALAERVDQFARQQKQSSEAIFRDAVSEYLDRQDQRRSFREDAIAAWTDYQRTGLHLTGDEADAWLAKLESGEIAAAPDCHI